MSYEISTQHYIAAQAHDAYANYIEAAIQGSVVPETDTAYAKCLEEDKKAMEFERALNRGNEGLATAYVWARKRLDKKYDSRQKSLHLFLVHVHRALAMDHAITLL